MAQQGRGSNLSRRSSSEDTSSHGRHGLSNHHLPLLQVDKSYLSGSFGHKTEEKNYVKDTNIAAAAKAEGSSSTTTHRYRASPRAEKIVADRINELSQLESPLLRELAQRLGKMLKIETPRCHKKFKHPYSHLHFGDRWEILQGCNDWKGLLDPIDRVLKAEILRYGEFAQATYDAFDGNRESKHYGTCKYTRANLLEKVGLENRGYEITNFLYATTNVRFLHRFLDRPSRKDVNEYSKQSNWIGFVAVCTSPEEILRLGRRDIMVVWRGTKVVFEWIANSMDYLSPAGFGLDQDSSRVRVEAGFLHLYKSRNPKTHFNKEKSAREQVWEAVETLVEKYKHDGNKLSITLTGHSLGSALATLCAYDFAVSGVNLLSNSPRAPTGWHSAESEAPGVELLQEDGPTRYDHPSQFSNSLLDVWDTDGKSVEERHHRRNSKESTRFSTVNKFTSDRIPITIYSFGGPKVGNQDFVNRVQQLGVAVLRVVNIHDRVPKLPGDMFRKVNEFVHILSPYKHVGVELQVDNEESDDLQVPAGIRRPHALEAYLHLIDKYQGKGKLYEKTFRDFALVNKHQDFLKPKLSIPPCWWQEENKGLVRDANGNWRFPDRDFETFPKTPQPEQEENEYRQCVHSACDRSIAAMSYNSSCATIVDRVDPE